jgi:hypothetical protein
MLAFTTGNIIWTQITPIERQKDTILPNLMAMALSVLAIGYSGVFKVLVVRQQTPLSY